MKTTNRNDVEINLEGLLGLVSDRINLIEQASLEDDKINAEYNEYKKMKVIVHNLIKIKKDTGNIVDVSINLIPKHIFNYSKKKEANVSK